MMLQNALLPLLMIFTAPGCQRDGSELSHGPGILLGDQKFAQLQLPALNLGFGSLGDDLFQVGWFFERRH